ncbi:unnamed protein product [Ceutorhynchus assimilis]|uniref:CFAP61 dimerisation domain-containing protein n=1 Tax=Ceutorhynchus assimilis TaxID=467358 RepID=A0A9N9MRE3_9CUCU|nr:unnamed protein product [Ceutorhynchus assimilis]
MYRGEEGTNDSTSSYEILKEMEHVRSHDIDPRLTYAELMDKFSRSIVSAKSRTLKLPSYAGKGNAFAIEVAATHPDHTSSIHYVLESVFECFPDREYCVLSTPTETPMEHWINSSFCRATPRPGSRFPNSLYICHKSSLLGCLECKVASKEHLTEVYNLLSTIPTRAIVLSHFEISMEFEKSPYQCFVFLCEGQIIGTAVVSEEFDIDYIDAQYDISIWVPLHCYKSGSYGVIESLIISPIYHAHGRFFKKELHRLSDYDVLFYKHRASDRGTYKERPVSSLLHWLQPVSPRKMPEYDFKMLSSEGYETTDALTRRDHYALYLSTICSSSNEKIVINSRIVVVGGSNTAHAFLESLLLNHKNPNFKINFNNVAIVSPDGINKKIPRKVNEIFIVQKNFMSEKYMESINLKAYVNVVIGNITTIDRRQKLIIVNDHKMLRYDLLFLMTGEKFQKPLQSYRLPFQENPMNMFLVNCAVDAYNAIKALKELQKDMNVNEDNIIVYGHFLQVYSCLAGLLEYGIPGNKIVLIEPFPYSMNIDKKKRHNISVFNDPDIYHSTMEYIKQQGIRMYSSYYFINWEYWEEENRILSVRFESKHKMLEMSCQAIFFFYDKTISPKIYQVVSQCGLVFDGRLVIDSNCKTNDDRIYAAGTLTKYSRKYYAQNLVHKFFNRVEIGTKLGERIRNLLVPGFVKKTDPKTHDFNFHLEIRDRLVTKYEKPIMRYCRLPGELYYLSIVKPGRRIPLESASSMENYGQVFITGSCRNLDHQGFFKIHFNEFNKVETITCLTKFPIDIKNIHCLWGKHEKLLNNLQLRFEMMLITDFFEYFKQPWAYAIYHDRFEILFWRI